MSTIICHATYPLDVFFSFKNTNLVLIDTMIPLINDPRNKNYKPPKLDAVKPIDINSQLYSNFKEIFNKLSDDNIDTLFSELKRLNINNQDHFVEICNQINKKAIIEQMFAHTYAKFVYKLMPCVINDDKNTKFSNIFLHNCKQLFEKYVTISDSDTSDRNKLLSIGCMKYIGELYNNNILNGKILKYCYLTLQKNISGKYPYNVDNLCMLFNTTYMKMKTSDRDLYDQCYGILNDIRRKTLVSKRELFAIINILEKL